MQRHLRLRQPADFARIRQAGRRYQHRLLLLNVAVNGLDHNRYGFVTSKQLGNAVIRNRARRVLRAAVRSLHSQLQPGYDIVIVARPALVGQPFGAIQRIIAELVIQSGLMRAESGLS